jgi:hypothetical protein
LNVQSIKSNEFRWMALGCCPIAVFVPVFERVTIFTIDTGFFVDLSQSSHATLSSMAGDAMMRRASGAPGWPTKVERSPVFVRLA